LLFVFFHENNTVLGQLVRRRYVLISAGEIGSSRPAFQGHSRSSEQRRRERGFLTPGAKVSGAAYPTGKIDPKWAFTRSDRRTDRSVRLV